MVALVLFVGALLFGGGLASPDRQMVSVPRWYFNYWWAFLAGPGAAAWVVRTGWDETVGRELVVGLCFGVFGGALVSLFFAA